MVPRFSARYNSVRELLSTLNRLVSFPCPATGPKAGLPRATSTPSLLWTMLESTIIRHIARVRLVDLTIVRTSRRKTLLSRP